jgi:hypothetical protein
MHMIDFNGYNCFQAWSSAHSGHTDGVMMLNVKKSGLLELERHIGVT